MRSSYRGTLSWSTARCRPSVPSTACPWSCASARPPPHSGSAQGGGERQAVGEWIGALDREADRLHLQMRIGEEGDGGQTPEGQALRFGDQSSFEGAHDRADRRL